MGTFASEGTRVALQIFTEAREKDVGSDRRNVPWSPENILIDTVARLQRDLADIRAESRQCRTPGAPPVVPTPWQAAFTTTKVPQFAGTTSWEQYRQVFDAIVLSNGWDDATAALQLLSLLVSRLQWTLMVTPLGGWFRRSGRNFQTGRARLLCSCLPNCLSGTPGMWWTGRLASIPMDEDVRLLARVACLAGVTVCEDCVVMPDTVGTLSPSDSDSVGPVGPVGTLSPSDSDSVGHDGPDGGGGWGGRVQHPDQW